MIEYFDTETLEIPKTVKFHFKSETSLYEFTKSKALILSVELSRDGEYFVILSNDEKIRIFKFSSGKVFRIYRESIAEYEQAQLVYTFLAT